MKRIIFGILFFVFSAPVFGQKTSADTIAMYFEELQTATEMNPDLWGKNLYGPVLFVEPQTRQIFANEPDAAGALTKTGNIYSGALPTSVSIANTALEWNGKYWAMIMLPLPEDRQDRLNLVAHESFHREQPALGFTPHYAANSHLDKKNGRIYLRLELAALKKAVQAASKSEMQQYLTDALTFRKYRHHLYPGSDTTENFLELNEGLSEFTGVILSGRNRQQHQRHFAESMDDFLANPTFVRSFAYETIPVYGYLLYNREKDWPSEISADTDLPRYFIEAFDIALPADLEETVKLMIDQYNGHVIIAEEKAREKRTQKLIAEYKRRFIDAPHLEIRMENLKGVSFDPRTIIPMDQGTVYPEIKVIDTWGILTVENGALITHPWKKITLGIPTKIEKNTISGDTWVLELADGYVVTKDENSGNYILTKE